MSKLLLLETATQICSVGLSVDGRLAATAEDAETNRHAERLTLLIEEVMQQAGMPLQELDAVALSAGPGSYTSLRVGASVAKGLCYALGKPLIAVDSLKALAYAGLQAWKTAHPNDTRPCCLMPMLDARRQEVWTALYDSNLGLLLPSQPLIMQNNLFETFICPTPGAKQIEVVILSGNGGDKAQNVFTDKVTVWHSKKLSSVQHMIMLAEAHFLHLDFQDIAYFEPFYMKPPNITGSKN